MFGRLVLFLGLVNVSLQVHFPKLHEKTNGNRASWGYSEVNGPTTWAESFPEFCDGTKQSPIDYVSASATVADPDPGAIEMVGYDMLLKGNLTNNGHSLVFSSTEGVTPYITGGRLGKQKFDLLQLHWHWGSDSSKGSEHTIDGKEFPLELHMVHINSEYGDDFGLYEDGAAVLGFLYKVSTDDNDNLTPLLSSITDLERKKTKKIRSLNKANRKFKNKKKPSKRADAWTVEVPTAITLNDLVPSEGVGEEYYYYSGGLTTPSCNEIVQWTSYINTVPVSEAQLDLFRSFTDADAVNLSDNFRPPQPLNGRTVFKRSPTVGTGNGEMSQATGSTAAADTNAALAAGTLGGIVLGAGAAFLINALFAAPQGRVARTRQSNSGTKLSQAEQLLKAAESLFG